MIKLETERLCLRDYKETDFEAYYKLKTDDQITYVKGRTLMIQILLRQSSFFRIISHIGKMEEKWQYEKRKEDNHPQVFG